MRVILHTDDLAITRHASEGILGTWRAGALDGFSVIANGDAADWVRDELTRDSARPARIAVHFNLTEGRACAAPTEVDLLTNRNGWFRNEFGGLCFRAMLGPATRRRRLAEQAERECRAQIRAVREICGARAVIAVDGHNHVHMIPGIFSAVVRAAVAEGVPEIRISQEPFFIADPLRDPWRPFWWANLLKHLLLRGLGNRARSIATAAGLQAPDQMIGMLYTRCMTADRALRGIAAADALGAETVEVVFHVGRATEDEAGRWRGVSTYVNFHLSPARETERTELLRLAAQPLVRWGRVQ